MGVGAMLLAWAVQAEVDDPSQVDLGAWIGDHPLWAAAAAVGLLLVLYRSGRWIIERPWRAVVLVVALGATVALGGGALIPFAAITFLVVGVVSAPYRWWARRRGPVAARPVPDLPPPPPMRCTAPTIGPCPIHGSH